VAKASFGGRTSFLKAPTMDEPPVAVTAISAALGSVTVIHTVITASERGAAKGARGTGRP
jgi:hypothetical protein